MVRVRSVPGTQVCDKPTIRRDHPAILAALAHKRGDVGAIFNKRSGPPWLEWAGDRRAAYDPLAAGADAMSKSIAGEKSADVTRE